MLVRVHHEGRAFAPPKSILKGTFLNGIDKL